MEGFGKQLQLVSLLSPDAAQQMEAHYSEYVSPALLKMWMSDAAKAPGRMVSSPWPDRIELTRFEEESPDRYAVAGFVVEITSLEVVGSGAPTRIPVRMIVEKTQGHWMITEYAEGR